MKFAIFIFFYVFSFQTFAKSDDPYLLKRTIVYRSGDLKFQRSRLAIQVYSSNEIVCSFNNQKVYGRVKGRIFKISGDTYTFRLKIFVNKHDTLKGRFTTTTSYPETGGIIIADQFDGHTSNSTLFQPRRARFHFYGSRFYEGIHIPNSKAEQDAAANP